MLDQFELRHVPQWFVAVFALTYITGYLIDSLYSSSLGINDASGEIIKLRHIQIGLGFLMLFSIITLPIFFLFFGRKKMAPLADNPNELPPMKGITALITILYFGSIYYAVVFTPSGYFYLPEHPHRLWTFLILITSVIFGYILFTGILARRRRIVTRNPSLTEEQKEAILVGVHSSNKKSQNIFLHLMLLYIFVLDYVVFEQMLPDFLDMIYPYGLFFFFFCFVFAAQLFRILRRLDVDATYMTEFAKLGLIMISGVGLLVLYYTSVAAFAYTIYTHIPSAKGGAKYSVGPLISISLDHPELLKNSIFVPSEGQLQNLVHLYSTPSSFYFGDVCDWQRGPGAILKINRTDIKFLVIDAPTPIKKIPNCPASPSTTTKLPEISPVPVSPKLPSDPIGEKR